MFISLTFSELNIDRYRHQKNSKHMKRLWTYIEMQA